MKRLLCAFLVASLAACGGGGSDTGSGPSTGTTPATPANVASLTVEAGPGNNVNIPYVDVTVCLPGTSTCQTIDHVLVDTGSTGLRLLASAVTGLQLPAHTTSTSSTITECAQFLNFVTWGPIKRADVAIGGKRAPSVPVQIIADPGFSVIPSSCGRAASAATSTSDLGANGVLGVGLFANDGQLYYNCNPTSRFTNCRTTLTAAQQVQNPVALFASDNNGVVVQLPALSSAGSARVEGKLIFGIDTQSNNQLGAARVIQTDSSGYFTTTYKGQALRNSFIDSGSNGLYFDDAGVTPCTGLNSGFYCPPNALGLSATMGLIANGSDEVRFSIGNAATLLSSTSWAYNNLGGVMSGPSFDWGLPFFFGRSVFTVIEGGTTRVGPGPLYAYTN
jgi:hypothetical protein